MMSESVDLEFLARQAKMNNKEMQLIRKDLAAMMTIVNATWEQSRRTDRRINEMRDDLELTVKMEIGGAVANLRTYIDNVLSGSEERFDNLETRVTSLEEAR